MRHADMSIASGGHGRSRVGAGGPGLGWLQPFWRSIRSWSERRRQRKALSLLDDRMLRDIGLTRFDIARETGKPFWRN